MPPQNSCYCWSQRSCDLFDSHACKKLPSLQVMKESARQDSISSRLVVLAGKRPRSTLEHSHLMNTISALVQMQLLTGTAGSMHLSGKSPSDCITAGPTPSPAQDKHHGALTNNTFPETAPSSQPRQQQHQNISSSLPVALCYGYLTARQPLRQTYTNQLHQHSAAQAPHHFLLS
jgi:hypothetical protein